MNHFLDEAKQSDLKETDALKKKNKLLSAESLLAKKPVSQINRQDAARVPKNQLNDNFESFLSEEVGECDTSDRPKVLGTL